MTQRDERALRYARSAFGVVFLLRTTPLLLPLHVPFSAQSFPLLGWPTQEWTSAVPGLVVPSVVVATLCIARTVAALLFTIGVRARVTGTVAALCGYLVLAQDRFAFINSLHVLFLGTLVLACTAPPARAASSVTLVRLFLASIYFWAGLAKLQAEWLSGRALEMQAHAGSFAGPLGGLVDQPGLRAMASISIPFAELVLAALLVADRRRLAVALGLAFHGLIELTVNPDTLGWQMLVLLLAIWPRDASPRDVIPITQAPRMAPADGDP
jgi:hypothetical protein